MNLYKKEICYKNSSLLSENSVSKEMFSSIVSECLIDKERAVIPLTSMDLVVIFKEADTKIFVENELIKIKNSVHIYMNTDVGFVQSIPFLLKEQMRLYLREIVYTARLSLYRGFEVLFYQRDADNFINELDREFYEQIIHICRAVFSSRYSDAVDGVNIALNALVQKEIKFDEAYKFIKKLFESLALSCAFYFENNNEVLQHFYYCYQRSATIENYKKAAKDFFYEIKRSPLKSGNKHYRCEVEKIIDYIKNL